MSQPALIVIDPVTPAKLMLVHIAQVEGWKLLRNIVGVLPAHICDGEVAIVADDWARVCATAAFHGLMLLAPNQRWHSDLPTAFICSEPNEIEYEFRCFIVDGLVVATSPHRHRGESCKTRGMWQAPDQFAEQAAEFCEQVLADDRVYSPPAFVVDVGLINNQWFVLDSRPAWGTEFLGCDMHGVMEALKRSCFSRSSINPDDARWCIQGISLFAPDIE